MDLISVIVPVYKAETYLDDCIISLVAQTYDNLEIILVDDESPDRCPSICDEWAKKDKRIRVIHTVNGGSARARNLALDQVHGDFVAFCDADDMMNPEMLMTLYNIAIMKHADIVECDYSIDKKIIFDKSISDMLVDEYDTITAMTLHIENVLFKQVIWNKLYARSIVDGVRFVEGKMIDDEFWTYKVIARANKLARLNKQLYFYRQQNESVMHRPYSINRLDVIEAHTARHELICEKFPEIIGKSTISLWLDCRYHGQMCKLYLPQYADMHIKQLQNILYLYPLKWDWIMGNSVKEIIWLLIEKKSLSLVCLIRNQFSIGL